LANECLGLPFSNPVRIAFGLSSSEVTTVKFTYVTAPIVFVLLISNLFAETVGAWRFEADEDGCKCRPLLIIERDQSGALSGTIAFPGAKVPLHNISVTTTNTEETAVQFTVEQPENDKFITYYYEASIEGDIMTGEYHQKDSTQTVLFHAKKRKK
jgi:hypothetical protein